MNLQQLQILRELGALGSVTAVAEALRVSPSAVSQQLAALQRGFTTPLTRKQGRTLVLTPAGEVLADAGATALDAMAAARTAVDRFEAAPSGVAWPTVSQTQRREAPCSMALRKRISRAAGCERVVSSVT